MEGRWPAALAVAGALMLGGCGRAGEGGGATNAPASRSAAREALEGFTGKTAVDAGKRMKSTLQKVDAERQRDIKEALEP